MDHLTILSNKQSSTLEVMDVINAADDLLRHKHFDECLKLSLKGISDAKNSPETNRTNTDVESLCTIAIQAYAELNRWQEVLPFVTQLYNGIEDCPGKIVKLCILLHAYMRDFTTCNAVAHIWLRNPRNGSNPLYSHIVEVFLLNVLLPQQKWKDVQPFLEGCRALTSEKQDRLLNYSQNIQKEDEEQLLKSKDVCRSKELGNRVEGDKINANKAEQPVKFIQDIYAWLTKFVPKAILNILGKFILLSLFLYWLLIKGHLEFISQSKLKNIFHSVLTLWRSMFAPFYLAK